MLNTADRRLLVSAFFLTGATGLVFQIIWTRLLVLSFGYTTYSVSTVVATFMGGLALGSYLGGRLADQYRRLITLYAVAEIIIGVFALAATLIFLQFPELVAKVRGLLDIPYHGFSIWVAVASLVVLLPPTILMGATLPILARAVTRAAGSGGMDISPLYGLNTFGAATGSLLTGFVALALLGITMTAVIAALTNILVGTLLAMRLHNRIQSASAASEQTDATEGRLLQSPLVIAFGISGFAALAAEVAWTRILAPFLEGSVYAYTLVVSMFLLGIASGTLVARGRAQEKADAERGFALAQWAVGITTLLGLLMLYPFVGTNAEILPDLGAIVRNPDILLATTLWFGLILFPSTFFMGVGFPFVAQWASKRFAELGSRAGKVYAINTLAAVVGSVLAGFILIPAIGVKNTLVMMALLSMLSGGWLLLHRRGGEQRLQGALAVGVGVLAAGIMAVQLEEPGYFATEVGYPEYDIVWHDEGIDTAVTLLGRGEQIVQLNIGLRPVSGTSRLLTPWMTHLPMLMGDSSEGVRVLNIGLGIGHTFDVAHAYPGTDVTVVELVPAVFEAFRKFRPNARELLDSERARVVLGDGRNYLLNQPDQSIDVVIVDPTPPLYGAGAVNLYTEDFFRIALRKMTPGGRLMMRLPYSADPASITMVIRSATATFPHVSLWEPGKGRGYSLIASPSALVTPTDDVLVARIRGLGQLSEEEREYLVDVRPRLINVTEELSSMVAHAPVVTDDHPYLEHPLYFPLWVGEE